MTEIRRRDDLPELERAVSDALDELNHICHGMTSSWSYPVDFLGFLADRHHAVVHQRDAKAISTLAETANQAARTLHPSPAELARSRSESGQLCPECISPAPCQTRRALDNADQAAPAMLSVDEHERQAPPDEHAAAVPAALVDAAQRYDLDHRPPAGWTSVPDEQARRLLAGAQLSGMVTVRLADLDLVMNHAGDPATVAEYPAAAQHIQDALKGGRRG